MKKGVSLLFLPIAFLIINGCSKSTTTTPAHVDDFSPLTTGSTWTYNYTENSTSNTFTLTVSGRDTTANSKTYKILSSSDGTASYLAKVGNDYYRFASFPAIGVNNFEELYLKDNKAVNDTWVGSANFKYSGADIKADLAYLLAGKGETRTVNGKSFTNVTHVNLVISVFGSKLGGGDFYYQEGVGLIEDNILVSPPGGGAPYSSKETIVNYTIK